MRRLVALAMPGGPRFVAELRRAWDAGDAVFPLDPRLPAPASRRQLELFVPAVLVDGGGERSRLEGGVPVEAGDALVVATSGTTGEPKAVVLTHDAVHASATATSARLGVDPGRDRWLACLPLAHVGGLSVVTKAIVTGTPVEVLAGFEPAEVLEAATGRGATLVSLVPTALARLGSGAAVFRKILLGGSAPPAGLPPQVVTTYGMTETGSGVVYDGLPLDGVEVRIGERDEILLRCPMLLRAYRDGSDPRRSDGFLATGDAGRIREGRLELHGRLSDLIVSGGENVWPAAVEAVLRRHPDVADVAVVGRRDAEWGERVVALVVPAFGTSPRRQPTLDELRALVKEHLGPWAAPRELVVVSELRRNSSGKLRRSSLGGSVAEP